MWILEIERIRLFSVLRIEPKNLERLKQRLCSFDIRQQFHGIGRFGEGCSTDPAFGFLQTTNWTILLAEPRLINGLLGLVNTPLRGRYDLIRQLL